jgi:hypothetical protein
MGLITKFFILFLFLLINFYSFSNVVPDFPTTSEGDLFHTTNAKESELSTSTIVQFCLTTINRTPSECFPILEAEIDRLISDYGNGTTLRKIATGNFTRTTLSNQIIVSKPHKVETFLDWTTPPKWSTNSTGATSQSANTSNVQVPVCPPSGFDNYRVEATVAGTLHCYEQSDLNTRDSCPDSTQDGAYVLPSNSNNSSDEMCLDKPDGSSCKYKKEGNVYMTDFENNCYELNGLPRFDESGISEIDPTDPDCQDLGNGVTACLENPDNVCDSSGSCNTGCGSVSFGSSDPTFVCLSGDTDGDGLADYLDPDIDGDGIANDLDLDADGDGSDDPKYPSQGQSMSVNVDMAGLENLTGDSNALLTSIDTELKSQNGSGTMPAYSTNLNQQTVTDSLISRISGSPVSLALSSMATAINFNTEGGCPELGFYLPSPIDKNVSTNTHCSMMPAFRLIITPVMFAIYLFMAFRIFAAA